MTFPETFTTCVVSTAHLPKWLAEAFDVVAGEDLSGDVIDGFELLRWDALPHGYRVYTDTQHLPLDIEPIVHIARKEGHRWVEFDCDADVVDGFEIWEW